MQILQERDDRVVAVLPNRLIIVTQNLPTTPVVTAQAYVKTGSVFEQQHVGAGLSHFLEHLVSGGSTTNRTEEESNAILGRTGARTNASTSLDTVRYFITSTKPYTEEITALLSDWLQNSVISEKEFERERQVIQREFAMGQGDPGRIHWKLTQRARYQHHPARHPTIGYLDEFMNITREELIAFYKQMYVPNNIIFTVVGDIDPRETAELVAQLWADVPTGELPTLQLANEPERGEPYMVQGYADIQHPRVRFLWPGVKLTEEHDYALDMLAAVLGRGESSRLVRVIRDHRRLVNSVSAYNFSNVWTEGFFGIDVELAEFEVNAGEGEDPVPQRIDRVRDAIFNQIDGLLDTGITPEELDRAKRKVLASALLSDQSAGGMSSRIASDLMHTGDPDYLKRYAQAVQAITEDDIRAAAAQFVQEDRLIEVQLLPATPDNPISTLERLTQSDDADVTFTANDLDNAGLIDRLKHAIANPVSDALAVQMDEPVMHTLDNGLRVVFQRSTAVPGVSVQIYQLGGLLSDEPGREGVANAAMSMLNKGTENLNKQQIAETLENLGASLVTASGNNTVYGRASCLSEDLPTVMEVFAQVWQKPSFPEDEWDTLRPRLVAAIERQQDSWSGELQSAFRAAYFGDHPWSQSVLGRAEVVAELTVQDLKQYHASRLGAADSVLAIVGDVSEQDALQLARTHFGALPEQAQVPFDPPTAEVVEPTSETVHTAKPVAAGAVGFGPGIPRANIDYAALRVMSRVLNDFPSGWLERALRGEGEGLAYAVWAYNVTGVVPGYFLFAYNAKPGAGQEAMDEALQVIERIRTEPIPQVDVDRAKAAVLTDEYVGKQSNGDRATDIALDELYGVSADQRGMFLSQVQALTPDQLSAIAQQYLVQRVSILLEHEPIEQPKPKETTLEPLFD